MSDQKKVQSGLTFGWCHALSAILTKFPNRFAFFLWCVSIDSCSFCPLWHSIPKIGLRCLSEIPHQRCQAINNAMPFYFSPKWKYSSTMSHISISVNLVSPKYSDLRKQARDSIWCARAFSLFISVSLYGLRKSCRSPVNICTPLYLIKKYIWLYIVYFEYAGANVKGSNIMLVLSFSHPVV